MADRPIRRPLRVLPAIDKVGVDVALDPLFDLEGLSEYSNISRRKLRDYVHDPVHPLPAYQVGSGGPFLVPGWPTTIAGNTRTILPFEPCSVCGSGTGVRSGDTPLWRSCAQPRSERST